MNTANGVEDIALSFRRREQKDVCKDRTSFPASEIGSSLRPLISLF